MSDKPFDIKAKGMLLTWYLGDVTLPFILDKLASQLVGKYYTINKESCPKTGTYHYHMYVHSHNQMDHTTAYWAIDDVLPNCQQNKINGSGYEVAKNRGHFYVECRYKIGHITQLSNYPWGECYIVRQAWIMSLWSSKKIHTHLVDECLKFYMCGTKRAFEIIEIALQYERTQKRKLVHEARKEQLQPTKHPFKLYPQIENFKEQFDYIEHRYKFLVVVGPSRLGKTELMRSHFPEAFEHKGSVDWTGYDPVDHSAIIFDDVPKFWDYIIQNKPLFQSNCEGYKVHTSATNCYSKEIDNAAKPIIITTNEIPYESPSSDYLYLKDNWILLELNSPTWADPGSVSTVV